MHVEIPILVGVSLIPLAALVSACAPPTPTTIDQPLHVASEPPAEQNAADAAAPATTPPLLDAGAPDASPEPPGCHIFDVQKLKDRCAGGEQPCCVSLALTYDIGRYGVPPDHAASAALLQRACDLANEDACYALAHHYEKGLGVARDPERALDLFEHLCSAGNSEGCASAGRLLWRGPGSKRNVERAGDLLLRACEVPPFYPEWFRHDHPELLRDPSHLEQGSACDSLFYFLHDSDVPARTRRALRDCVVAACRDGKQDVCTLVRALDAADAERGR